MKDNDLPYVRSELTHKVICFLVIIIITIGAFIVVMDDNNEMEELVAKLEKVTEIIERRYGSPLSKMDRLEASVNAMAKAVNTLADSVDRLLSSSIGVEKTVEFALTTDEHRVTPLTIRMEQEFCDDP
ncbi:uncharacterized protein G2W53_041330 [Senna tora]|uniref:Uncharacterized protein n=1 Tax=Senna tora TaxID=362788 RepID=A0A834W2S8_9FABA|nr:uncharacterized protein G2W53_041330 [Senna tora]